tara:strand:+ start:840 stop:1844 length:1005 start_codon:yes stop_codon:yes gene_type:complete
MELQAATKAALHPLVSLGKLGRLDQSERVLTAVSERVGPCFLDLNTSAYQTCGDWEVLCDPADDYGAWRTFVRGSAGITPVALLRNGTNDRPFIRQVLKIEEEWGVVVIRSRRPSTDLPALQGALAAVNDVNNVLIVLDFGYVRQALEPKEADARRVISALRMTDPSARVVVMGSSFPKSVAAYGENSGTLEILERDLHAQIGGDEVAIYGDHSSIYPEPFEPSISRYVPRVDYCTDTTWLYRRRREDDGGYVDAATRVIQSEDWDPDFAARSWGANIIRLTAENGAQPGFGSPANWIAARVNMHIERQTALSLAADGGAGNGNDGGFEDDGDF